MLKQSGLSTMGGGFPHQQAVLWHPLGVLQFSSIWTLSGDSVRYEKLGKGLVVNCCPGPRPPSNFNHIQVSLLDFWPNSCTAEVEMNLFLWFNYFSEFTETFYLLNYQSLGEVQKGQMKETHRAQEGQRLWGTRDLSPRSPLPDLQVRIDAQSLQRVRLGLYGGFSV